MPRFHAFTPEEFAAQQQKGGQGRQRSAEKQRLIEEFKTYLEPLAPGAGGEVELEDGEVKRKVRTTIKEAAKELEKPLKFLPIRDEKLLRFQVITVEQKAAQPKRGGRPKKKTEA